MEEVQGFGRSHWTPLLVEYSLRFALAAALVSIKTTTIKNAPTLPAIWMAMAVRRYNTARIARWRRSRAMLDATGCRHRASIAADSSQSDIPTPFFYDFHAYILGKGARVDTKAPINNRGMTYQNDEKDLGKTI
jgi:hypothetical protein